MGDKCLVKEKQMILWKISHARIAKNRPHSCFFHWAALLLRNILHTVSRLVCQASRAVQASQNCLTGFLCTRPAFSVCHIVSGIVFRTVRLGGHVSLPRGCHAFAVGDLWPLLFGKCCWRLEAEWLREAVNSLRWEAYTASATRIINFAF